MALETRVPHHHMHHNGFRAWSERNPLVTFFVLTYAISWTVWLTQPWLSLL